MIPYIKTDKTITVMINNVPKIVDLEDRCVPELIKIINSENPDMERLVALTDPITYLGSTMNDSDITVMNGTVLYKGKRVGGHLEDRIIDIAAAGLDVKPWKRFATRLYNNPSMASRNELELFLEVASLPLTPDGCFLAYKRVRENYKDWHSNTFDNSIGKVVEMPGGRENVDDNREVTCSYGLHFCSKNYLKNFYSGNGKIVIVKIDPADVVSIPSDYNNTKGRCWRYTVVGEIPTEDAASKKEWGIINYDYIDDPSGTNTEEDEDDWDRQDIEEDDREFESDSTKKSFWRSFKKIIS